MVTLGEIGKRRIRTFKANRRGYWSLWIFSALFIATLFAEVVANDEPLLVRYGGAFYFPAFQAYPETMFGGFLETEADYSDPEVQELIEEKGWIVWPLIPFSFDTICYNLPTPAPSPPTTLALALKKRGLDAQVVIPDGLPDFLRWMPGISLSTTFAYKKEKASAIITEADLVFC